MANSSDINNAHRIINRINYSVISNSNSPKIFTLTLKFFATLRSRLIGKVFDFRKYPLNFSFG